MTSEWVKDHDGHDHDMYDGRSFGSQREAVGRSVAWLD